MANFATKTQIRAEDMASPAMKRIAAQARITARSFERLNAAANTLKRLGGAARVLERGAVVAGFASASAAAGVLALASRYADATDETAKFARQTGFSTASLERLKFIADRQGASFQTVTGGVEAFTKRMGELRAGSGSLLKALKDTDPAFATMLAGTTDNEEAFRLFIEKVGSLPTEQAKAALAAAGVSRGAMAAIIRLSDGGEEALARLRAQADKFRAPMTQADADNAEAYKDALTNANFALKGVSDTIGKRALPVMTPFVERLADWVALNRPLLDAKLDAYGDKVAVSLAKVDFDKIADAAERYRQSAGRVIAQGRRIVASLGGIEGVISKVAKAWLILKGLSIAGMVLTVSGQVVAFASAIAGIGTATAAARVAAVGDFDAIERRYGRLSKAIGKGIVAGGVVGVAGAVGVSKLNENIDKRAAKLEGEGFTPEAAQERAKREVTGEANDAILGAIIKFTDRLGALRVTDERLRERAGVAPYAPPPPQIRPLGASTLPAIAPATPTGGGYLERLRGANSSAPARMSTPIARITPLRVQMVGGVKVEVEAAQGTGATIIRNDARVVEPRRKPDVGQTMAEEN